MATTREEARRPRDGTDDAAESDTGRPRLAARHDTARRLPHSDDIDETTVTPLDGRPDETTVTPLDGRPDETTVTPLDRRPDETTVTPLDGRPDAESRPTCGGGAQPVALPSVALPSSSDGPWSGSRPPAETDRLVNQAK